MVHGKLSGFVNLSFNKCSIITLRTRKHNAEMDLRILLGSCTEKFTQLQQILGADHSVNCKFWQIGT